VDIFTSTIAGYSSSGVGLGLLVRLEKSLLDRGSPLVCVVRDKTRAVGPACSQGSQGVLGAFLHCDNCDKTRLPVYGTQRIVFFFGFLCCFESRVFLEN